MMRRIVSCALLFAVALVLRAQVPRSAGGAALSPEAAAVFSRGTEDLRADRADDAIVAFKQVTRASPRFVEAYLNLGLALTQVGRNREAIAALEQAIALRPALRGAHLFLAIAEYKLSRFDRAGDAVHRETALNPEDAQAWMWQGIIDLARGKVAFAVESLNRAAAISPQDVDILYHRGRAALALSRESYEAMFQKDPTSWHVHQVLAEAAVEQNNDAEAVVQFKQAIAAAPPQSGLYEALGSSLWRTGKYPEAQEAYETALKIDPDDTLTIYKLGCLRVDRGDAAGGKPLLERVRAADPSLKMTGYYLGRAAAQMGDDQQAIGEFRAVITENADPDTTKQAYFQLSREYRRLHDEAASAEAQAHYRELDQRYRDTMQERVRQKVLRADRSTSIPAPAPEPADAQP